MSGIYIWVNDHISLTWIKAIKGDDFPKINNDSQSSGEQGSVIPRFPQINALPIIMNYY